MFILGKYEAALLDFDKAIEFDSKFAQAWSNKSAVLEKLGNRDEALMASLKAIELDPKLALAWANNSLILRVQIVRRKLMLLWPKQENWDSMIRSSIL